MMFQQLSYQGINGRKESTTLVILHALISALCDVRDRLVLNSGDNDENGYSNVSPTIF